MDSIVLDTPESIQLYRIAALKGRLTLESKGIKFRGASGLQLARRILNYDFPASAKGRQLAIQVCQEILDAARVEVEVTTAE